MGSVVCLQSPRWSQLGHLISPRWSVTLKRLISSAFTGLLGRVSRQSPFLLKLKLVVQPAQIQGMACYFAQAAVAKDYRLDVLNRNPFSGAYLFCCHFFFVKLNHLVVHLKHSIINQLDFNFTKKK